MSIFNIFFCCTKQKQIDISLADVPVTNLQTPNTDVPISSITVGNLTFNYTIDGIDVGRIENIFKNINSFNCGKTQLRQLNEALNGSTIYFKQGDVYSCNLELVSENKTKIVFTLPPNPPSELVIPCVTLPEGSQSSDITNDFKMLRLTNSDTEIISERTPCLKKSPEEIEAYLMGHENFHAISSLVDFKKKFGDYKTTISEDDFKKHRMNRAGNGIQKYSTFFDSDHMDDVKNLFGLGFLNQTERIIGEFDFLRAITNKNIIRFPYYPIALNFILGGIEDQDLKQLAFNEYVACIKNESVKNNFHKKYENNLNEFFNDTKVSDANKMINEVKAEHEKIRQDIQKVVAYELHSYTHIDMNAEMKEQEAISCVLETQLSAVGYRLQDVPMDGNCAFWAILVAKGKISQKELDKLMSVWDKIKREKGYSPNWSECGETILAEVLRAVKEMINLRKDCGLSDLGSWIGNENFQQISKEIKSPIILVQTVDESLAYSLYNKGNNGTILEEQTIEQILNNHNNAIFIYYANNHFQAIVPNS